MAMNLRLRPETEEALREEARRSGRSQQEIVRAAVDDYLASVPEQPARGTDPLLTTGKVHPPRRPYRRVTPTNHLPEGVRRSLDLLDREDRF
ncbi:ribbon-helix-helix protein, CopG family [Saccharomonospora azurea]